MLPPEKEDSLIFSDGRRLLVLETMRCLIFGFDCLSRPLNVHRGVDSPRKCFLFLSIFSPDLPKLPQHKRSNLGKSLGWRQQSADRGLAEKTCEGREGGVFCLLMEILPTILQPTNPIDSPGVDAGRPGRHPLELELPRQGVQLQM